MRTFYDPQQLPADDLYHLLTATVVPRPIAWISTRSAAGIDNLAPYSFFTVTSANPAIVQFTSVGHKDSVRNIEETGEFVVNLTSATLVEAVNQTGAPYLPEQNEFDEVGIIGEPADRVNVSRVAAAPVTLECTLHQIIEVGNAFVVMGQVIYASAHTQILAADGLPSFNAVQPLSRLGRTEWGFAGETQDILRPTIS
ncbi:MAG: flavin reductase family protein [Mycobacteriaceae bacterium]